MFQQQRRGIDQLGRTMLIAALALSLIGMIAAGIGWLRIVLSLLSGALLVLIVLRMFSKDFNKRNQENMKYLTYENAVKDWFRRTFRTKGASGTYRAPKAKRAGKNPTWSDLKQYKYLICPQCAQRLRVPRGKGRIRVTCTNCGNVFETRS